MDSDFVKPDQTLGFLFTVLQDMSRPPTKEVPVSVPNASLSLLFDLKESQQPLADQKPAVIENPEPVKAEAKESDQRETELKRSKEFVDKLAIEHECGICYELLH